MKKVQEGWLAAGLITLVTLLTYGVLVPRLGFYRDDWYLFSTYQSQGPAGVIALFNIDRPMIGYFYIVALKLLGMSPLAWQVATLALRVVANLAFLWLLRILWPDRSAETLAIALLFSVYPGYTEMPNAGVYITDIATIAAATLSIGLSLKALLSPRRPVQIALAALAGLLALFYLGMFESAIGLEAVRFGLFAYAIWQRDHPAIKQTLWRALKADTLYLALSLAFLVWRLFLFQSTRRATNLDVLVGRYKSMPLYSLLSVAVETVKDVIETAIFAWIVPFYQFVAKSNYRDLALATAVAVLVAAAAWFVMRTVRRGGAQEPETGSEYSLQLIWLGAGIVVLALIPIDLAGRNVLFSDQWDRYTIYASGGVAMLVAGFLFRYFDAKLRNAFLLVLIGMSVVVHYFSAAAYRDFWTWERDLWQQMVWRAPGLQRGTMLFAILPGAGYAEGYEIYGPANMVYYPGQGVQIGGDVLNSQTAAAIQLQKNRSHYDRSVLVDDNYRNTLIAVYPTATSCLHVIDGHKVELPGLLDNSLLGDVAAYSRIEQVDVQAKPATLPTFLGGEQPRRWCYYYEKMDLRRQQGDWKGVAQLMDEAQSKGLKPEDVSEWMPALEAYLTLGRAQDARHAASIIRSSDPARAYLCLQLQRGAAYPAPYPYNQVNQTLCQATE